MAKAKQKGRNNDNGANLGSEAQLWATADKLRGNMEPSDYKHVALGLIFLKYISDAFEAKRAELLREELTNAEDPEEYLAGNVFWVPKEARWSHLRGNAKQPAIGKIVDDAMLAIDARNESLKADSFLASPPFNISDWGGNRLREDARWTFGILYLCST